MKFPTFDAAIAHAETMLERYSDKVSGERWQGVNVADRPEAVMHETRYVNIEVPITWDMDKLKAEVKPNLPWADHHFDERVCGEPLNPGKQWAKWPYANKANTFRNGDGQFNHTYMERYWPRLAGLTDKGELSGTMYDGTRANSETRIGEDHNTGIRYRYGDLMDLVMQLKREPLTRQAYLPIFFPEDTGVANPDRKPCTLGYFFLMRNDRLDITYYIRSCDYVRHFRDDIYMTIKLLMWVLCELRQLDARWNKVNPGLFRMDIGSLHCFVNDYRQLFGK